MGLSLLCDVPGTVSAGSCGTPPALASRGAGTPCASPAQPCTLLSPCCTKGSGSGERGGQGTPKCSRTVEDRLSIQQVLVIQGIFKIKPSLHGAGESSCHSPQLAPPAALCFGESKGGARAPPPAPHSHTAASDMKSITFPLPLLDFHCREAAQTHLRAECSGHRSLALLPPVPTLPAQEGYG